MNLKFSFSKDSLKGVGFNLACCFVAFFAFYIFASLFLCDIGGIPGDPRGKPDQIEILKVIAGLFFYFIGAAQLVYVIPIFLLLKRKQKNGVGRGFVLGACIVLMISVGHFVYVALAK